jgi:hypothetical protein
MNVENLILPKYKEGIAWQFHLNAGWLLDLENLTGLMTQSNCLHLKPFCGNENQLFPFFLHSSNHFVVILKSAICDLTSHFQLPSSNPSSVIEGQKVSPPLNHCKQRLCASIFLQSHILQKARELSSPLNRYKWRPLPSSVFQLPTYSL